LAVVLLHELGHYAAMRATGYRDVRIFFVPFLAAATAGRQQGVTPLQEGVVLLAGPVPGIVLGTGLLPVALASGHELAFEAAAMLIAVNAFNLLPLGALDGGKLVALGAFRRWPAAERGFAVVG